MYSSIADRYWCWAVLFIYCLRNKNVLKFEAKLLKAFLSYPIVKMATTTTTTTTTPIRAADPKGTMSYRTEGGISVRPWGAGAL